MAGFMAVGADDGHLSECAIFAIKKTNGTYVWPEARGPRLGLEKQPAVAAQWVARAMFVDARSHVGDPRRGSPCTVGSAGGQSITTVRQAPPVGAIDYRLHAPRPEEGQSSAATGYAGALAPKAPPRRQLAGAGLAAVAFAAAELSSSGVNAVVPPASLRRRRQTVGTFAGA